VISTTLSVCTLTHTHTTHTQQTTHTHTTHTHIHTFAGLRAEPFQTAATWVISTTISVCTLTQHPPHTHAHAHTRTHTHTHPLPMKLRRATFAGPRAEPCQTAATWVTFYVCTHTHTHTHTPHTHTQFAHASPPLLGAGPSPSKRLLPG